MMVSWAQLTVLAAGYGGFLLLAGYLANREVIAPAFARHPGVRLLSAGLIFGTWPLLGLLGLSHQFSGSYLTWFISLFLLFASMPVLLRPILRIAHRYQLNSLADILAFRYRSRWVGALVTLALTLISLPFSALQIEAIVSGTRLLLPNTDGLLAGLAVAGLAGLVGAMTGVRRSFVSREHPGLLFVLSVDNLLRLLFLLLFAVFLTWAVFGTPLNLVDWSVAASAELSAARQPLGVVAGLVLGMAFVLTPIIFPPLLHVLLRQPLDTGSDRWLQRGLLMITLVVGVALVPVFWSGIASGYPAQPALFLVSLGAHLQVPTWSMLAWLMVFTAALFSLITGAVALASMWINHALLPFAPPRRESSDIYRWLIWVRRILVAGVIAAGGLFFLVTHNRLGLTSLGIVTSIAAIQLLPGLIGLLYWQGGSRAGLIAGLGVGMAIWMALLGVPLLVSTPVNVLNLPLNPQQLSEQWFLISLLALAINAAVFVGVSLMIPPASEERNAAAACLQNAPLSPGRRGLRAHNAREFIAQLAQPLGQVTAEREVERALRELGYSLAEYRPFALRHLRDRLEINLSGFLGPSVANTMIERHLAMDEASLEPAAEDLYLVENRLEGLHDQLTGMARELDQLRRFHRDTLMRLPIGVFSLARDHEILLWNQVMEELTGVPADIALGADLSVLPDGWRQLLTEFLANSASEAALMPLTGTTPTRWLSLHRSGTPRNADMGEAASVVVLVDDQTQTKLLEDELIHNERLAAIGRLSAGVAHEIGNPVTGIDSLAQELTATSNDDTVVEIGAQIRQQTYRINGIVQSLVSYAHGGQQGPLAEHQPHRLSRIVQDAINLLTLSKDARPVQLLNEVDDEYLVPCDPQRLGQVFINLLTNARDASEPGGRIEVTAQADSHRLLVSVTDEGHGIPEEVQDKMLEPFFTTKEVGKGTGLGLSLASNIIEEHYGQLEIESPADTERQRGTRIIITLPLHQRN